MASPKNILIIDHNDSHYELVCQTLAHGPSSPRLTRAINLEAGRRLLQRHQFDLIVTENRHDGDDEEWISNLKKGSQGAPVVVLTSKADQKKAISAMKMGADDYIIKNRDILKNLSEALANTMEIHKKKAASISYPPMIRGGINVLARNLKTISRFLNQPSQGLAQGKKQIRRLEREIENLKGMIKNLVA